jgi:hypothetical protein
MGRFTPAYIQTYEGEVLSGFVFIKFFCFEVKYSWKVSFYLEILHFVEFILNISDECPGFGIIFRNDFLS